MKKILLIILLLAQPIYADSNGMSKFIIPHVTICDFDDPYPYNLVDIAREIAEFEANLAKDLADKAAQEIMVEIEAEFEAKAKLPNTVCEVTEGERISYLAYISGAVNSSDDLYTTTCKEQSLEGLQRMGSSWQTAERPLRTYFIQKTKGCGYLDDGMNINGYNYKTACYLISDNEYPDYPDDLMCTEIWTLDTNELYKIACQVGINNFVFSPNDWFHKSNFHGDIKDFGYVHNRDTYRQDMLTVSVGRCSL